MARIFGALLDLTASSAPGAPAALDDVATIALNWAGVRDATGAVEGDFTARNAGDVRAQRFEPDETGAAAWRMAFQHPSGEDRGVIWRTAISVVEDHTTRAVIELGRFVEDGVSRPWDGGVDPPRLVRDLIQAPTIEVLDGGIRCRAEYGDHESVGVDDVDSVLRLAFHPGRRLPIVLFTEGRTGGVVDLNRLQRRLAGIAHIVKLDPNASWFIAQETPRGSTPWGGWTRLWWPGFSPSSHKSDAPWWTPDARAADVVAGIERLAITAATQSFSVLPEFKAIQAKVRERRSREVAAEQAAQVDRLGAWRDQQVATTAIEEQLAQAKAEILGLRALLDSVVAETKASHEEDLNELVQEYSQLESLSSAKDQRIAELEREITSLQELLGEHEASAKLRQSAERFREEMRGYYNTRWEAADREARPFGEFYFHPEFFESLNSVAGDIFQRVVRTCVIVAANHTESLKGHEAAPGSSGKPRRASDRAVAMREYLEESRSNARRLLYWRRPDEQGIEFVRCALHDDYAISEVAVELL